MENAYLINNFKPNFIITQVNDNSITGILATVGATGIRRGAIELKSMSLIVCEKSGRAHLESFDFIGTHTKLSRYLDRADKYIFGFIYHDDSEFIQKELKAKVKLPLLFNTRYIFIEHYDTSYCPKKKPVEIVIRT